MLRAVFFVQDKIYHVYAFAMRPAVGRKAIAGMRFVIHLQAGGLIIVEGAVQP
jgi:hypothetical protein